MPSRLSGLQYSCARLSMGWWTILPGKTGTQGRQPLNILFKFRQLVLAIHPHHQFKKICRRS